MAAYLAIPWKVTKEGCLPRRASVAASTLTQVPFMASSTATFLSRHTALCASLKAPRVPGRPFGGMRERITGEILSEYLSR